MEDLVRLFSEAVVGQKVSEDFNSDDEDQPVPAVKESREYRQAIALAKKLVTVMYINLVYII